MEKSELEKAIYLIDQDRKKQFFKSLLDEQICLKNNMLYCIPELYKLVNIESIELNEWVLNDGVEFFDVLRLLLYNAHITNTGKLFSFLDSDNNSMWERQDGKAFMSDLWLFLPPTEIINVLLDGDYLSLYECIFLVGYANDNEATLTNSVNIAISAIANNIILPRDPETHLKYGEAPTTRINGEFVHPDFSWLLTFDEAEQWAVNSFGVSIKALRDRLAIAPPLDKPLIQIANSTEHSPDTQTADNELSEREETKYLRIIGLLAETLANTNKPQLRNPNNSVSLGNGELGKTGETNLIYELLKTEKALNNNSEIKGLGKTTLQNIINEGVKALRDSL